MPGGGSAQAAAGPDTGIVAAGQSVFAGQGGTGPVLYFDKRLSADGTVSCATCHDPAHGFTDGAAVSTGIEADAAAAAPRR